MKKNILFALLTLCLNLQAFADKECFIAQENNQILKQTGNCIERHSPCSTFKIPLSLMGFNEGILVDETHPEWPFKPEYSAKREIWKQPHHPTTWMKNSCIWYSQVMTTKMGLETFKSYVSLFKYGNQDITGDVGKNNGLTHSWLSSSLKISGEEQIAFLQKLLRGVLPVSAKAHELTRKILFIEELPKGWKLYGKTGRGPQRSWFIGWLEKGDRKIVFTQYIEGTSTTKRANEIAKEKLLVLISQDSDA